MPIPWRLLVCLTIGSLQLLPGEAARAEEPDRPVASPIRPFLQLNVGMFELGHIEVGGIYRRRLAVGVRTALMPGGLLIGYGTTAWFGTALPESGRIRHSGLLEFAGMKALTGSQRGETIESVSDYFSLSVGYGYSGDSGFHVRGMIGMLFDFSGNAMPQVSAGAGWYL